MRNAKNSNLQNQIILFKPVKVCLITTIVLFLLSYKLHYHQKKTIKSKVYCYYISVEIDNILNPDLTFVLVLLFLYTSINTYIAGPVWPTHFLNNHMQILLARGFKSFRAWMIFNFPDQKGLLIWNMTLLSAIGGEGAILNPPCVN